MDILMRNKKLNFDLSFVAPNQTVKKDASTNKAHTCITEFEFCCAPHSEMFDALDAGGRIPLPLVPIEAATAAVEDEEAAAGPLFHQSRPPEVEAEDMTEVDAEDIRACGRLDPVTGCGNCDVCDGEKLCIMVPPPPLPPPPPPPCMDRVLCWRLWLRGDPTVAKSDCIGDWNCCEVAA
jgi:hypothetical protein